MFCALAAVLLACSSLHAAVITYMAVDLADPIQGSDLWRYTYRVSDFSFSQGQGFSIFFSPLSYQSLQASPPAPNANWDVITLQPDLALNSSGIFDAQALIDAPSLNDAFSVDFIWLGSGAPGSQPFNIHDSNFSVLTQGITVPEPAADLLVFGTAAIAVGLRRRRLFSSKRILA